MSIISYIPNKKFFISRGFLVTVLSAVILMISMLASYLYNPKFLPSILTSTNKKIIDTVIGEELATAIDQKRDTDGAISIRTLFNTNKEENLVRHCEKKEEKGKEQEKCFKTYKDEEFGYSISYLEGWTQGKNNNIVGIKPSEESMDGIFIYGYDNVTDPIESWFDSRVMEQEIKFVKVGESTINGARAIEFKQTEGMEERHFVISNDNKILDILVLGIEDKNVQEVINSIKF